MLYPAGQRPDEEWPPNCIEEKVAHNGPLLRRVTDPFSKRTVVDNFQEARGAQAPDSTHSFGGRGQKFSLLKNLDFWQ